MKGSAAPDKYASPIATSDESGAQALWVVASGLWRHCKRPLSGFPGDREALRQAHVVTGIGR
jgi:hypothetical protein